MLRIATVLLLMLTVAACADDPPLVPETATTGSITGQVTIDGTGAAGVTVTLSSGVTATTGATGRYSFVDVPAGAYTVTISGYPNDAAFPATTQAAVIATSGQTALVNFAGVRRPPSSGTPTTLTGTLTVIGGDTSHDPFVFNAGGGKPAVVRIELNGNNVTITGQSGFAPSSLPTLSGTVDAATGAGAASGTGTIAGHSNVSVTATGTLAGGGLQVEIVVGGQGELPGGQPIRYRFANAL